MKYVILLLGVVVVYFMIARKAPIVPAVETISASEVAPLTTGPRAAASTPAPGAPASHSNVLKSPIDRTHAVLDQVKQRNGNGEF